jgi:DnaJ-class molecular chaperone
MSGYLPPGCTQQECDEAQPGYWDPPQTWHQCDACDGSGVEVFGTFVYEPGCGFGHDSTDERPCGKCNGAGGWVDDVEPDQRDMTSALRADAEKLRQLTGEDHDCPVIDDCPF